MFAMLSLDLDYKTTSERREKFYEYLKKEEWTKVPRLTTIWYARFNEGILESRIIEITKIDVAAAAKTAGVTSYDCVVNVSNSKPTTF